MSLLLVPANLILPRYGSNNFENHALQCCIIGALQDVTITRSELGNSVNEMGQLRSHALQSHWTAVKRMLKYLKGTSDLGFLLQPATLNPLTLKAVCDVDCASDTDDKRSTSGA